MYRSLLLLIVLLFFAGGGWAQPEYSRPAPSTAAPTQPEPTISSVGTASTLVTPEFVEFRIRKRFTGPSIEAAVEQALEFETKVRDALAKAKLIPLQLVFSGIAIPDTTKLEVYATLWLRFTSVVFNDQENGPRQFAALCDKMRAFAESMDCSIKGPIIGVQDQGLYEDHTVGEAVRNAYSAGEAAAAVMDAELTGVVGVEVLSIEWRADNTPDNDRPDFKRLDCTARVRVSYAFAAL